MKSPREGPREGIKPVKPEETLLIDRLNFQEHFRGHENKRGLCKAQSDPQEINKKISSDCPE